MKFTIAVLAIAIAVVSGEVRTKRGVLAAPYVAPYVAPYASYAASYYTPYYSPYVAAPNPVIARASRVVGAPGFAAKYYSPYVAAPVAAYTVL